MALTVIVGAGVVIPSDISFDLKNELWLGRMFQSVDKQIRNDRMLRKKRCATAVFAGRRVV